MHSRRRFLLALAAIPFTLQAGGASAHEVWRVTGGRTTFNFQAERLEAIGISLENVNLTATAPDPIVMDIEPPYWNMAITPESDLQFEVDNEHFVYWTPADGWGSMGGSIHHRGGLTFHDRSGATGEFRDFVIDFVPSPKDLPDGENPRVFFARQPNSPRGAYTLEFHDEMPIFHRDQKRLIMYASVEMTPEFAHQLGHDWMAHQCIGRAELAADVEYVSGTSTEPPFVPWTGSQPTVGHTTTTGLDVSLGALSGITEYGRIGTYPNGTSGISMATTSCNLGTVDVNWLAPMNVDHPGIVMAVYREENGRLEQVGVSFVKHGFFALSESACTPCQHPSPGSFLGVGCSDIYSAGNNADRTYLAPRREWNPFTSRWRCNNTHFSGYVDDCTRRHGGSGHDPVQHRCETPDSTLNHAGATYYYEGEYVVHNDVLKHNNAGSRRFVPTWTGSAWNLSTPGTGNPLLEGPAIERWGDLRTMATMAPDDGNVYVAVKTTDLGGGVTHYEYAVYNFDSFREVHSVTIPVGSATITNIGFHAPVAEVAIEPWTMTLSSGSIRWESGSFGADSLSSNALTFGYLFNFRFDAYAPPKDGSASLESWRPGAPGPANFATRVPDDAQRTSVASATMPGIRIEGARPNPLNPTTTISFSLGQAADAKLEIFGAEGRRVKSLESGRLDAGAHQLTWDGTDASGARVAPGVYYYRLMAGGEEAAQSLVVIR